MGAGKHDGRVDSCFHSPTTLKRRVIMKPSRSAAWALVEVGVMDLAAYGRSACSTSCTWASTFAAVGASGVIPGANIRNGASK
jgi:hypothetical protein